MHIIRRRFSTVFTRRFVIPALAAAIILALGHGTAHAADHTASPTPAVKRGDALFHQRCAICHNKQPGDTAPFGPPNLYDAFRNKTITTSQAMQIIHHGKGQMPPFGTTITDTQIRDVIAYLRFH